MAPWKICMVDPKFVIDMRNRLAVMHYICMSISQNASYLRTVITLERNRIWKTVQRKCKLPIMAYHPSNIFRCHVNSGNCPPEHIGSNFLVIFHYLQQVNLVNIMTCLGNKEKEKSDSYLCLAPYIAVVYPTNFKWWPFCNQLRQTWNLWQGICTLSLMPMQHGWQARFDTLQKPVCKFPWFSNYKYIVLPAAIIIFASYNQNYRSKTK